MLKVGNCTIYSMLYNQILIKVDIAYLKSICKDLVLLENYVCGIGIPYEGVVSGVRTMYGGDN